MPASLIQILPQQYTIADSVPIQNIMPNVSPNVYTYNSLMPQTEPIILQNIASYSVPPTTMTVLNSNVNNIFPTASVPSTIHFPNAGKISKQSSSLQLNVDYKQNNRIKKTKSKNTRNQNSNEIMNQNELMHNNDWCEIEKGRIAQMYRAIQWMDETVEVDNVDGIQPPRKMGPKCSSDYCKNSSIRHCYDFSEQLREEIFNFFWKQLNWIERKIYVCGLIKFCSTKQSCNSQKSNVPSLNYFLRISDNEKSVCKKMFINTIGIAEQTLRLWMSQIQCSESITVQSMGVPSTKENITCKSNAVKSPENVFESKQQESPGYWIREKVKKARERGEAYFGYSIKKCDAKTGRRSYGRAVREQRSLGPPCTSAFCKRSTKRQCSRFSQTVRQNIFDIFWKTLGWDERKAFITQSVDLMQPKRRTCIDVESSRRGVTCSYFLYIDDNRYNICRQLFLSTLGIKEATVQYWLMQNSAEQEKQRENNVSGHFGGDKSLNKSKRIRLPDQHL